jgi:hypothetical protein
MEAMGVPMKPHSFALGFVAALLVAGLAFADPRLDVQYFSGVPMLELEGNYPGSHYTIWRATDRNGPFDAITNFNTLCLGSCYGPDYEAEPGHTYWYRFDLVLEDGRSMSFGPYRVTISPALAQRVGIRAFPNPGGGITQVELHLAGGATETPLEARATLHDLQGRMVREIYSGRLRRGLTTVTWDGRGANGVLLRPGQYFLRLSSPLGTAVARVVRAH